MIELTEFFRRELKKAYTLLEQTGLDQPEMQTAIPSAIYAHILHIRSLVSSEDRVYDMGKILLLYLSFQLRADYIKRLAISISGTDEQVLISENEVKHLQAITKVCLVERQTIILPLSDMSHAAYFIHVSDKPLGCLAVGVNMPGFFTFERLEILERYTDLATLLFNG